MNNKLLILIAPVILILANVFFVGSFSLAKLLTKDVAVPVIMLFRFIAGPLYLGPYIAIKNHSITMTQWPILIIRILCGVTAMSALFFSFKYGDIGKSTLIFELSIIWTVLIELVVFKKRPHIYSLLAIPVVFLGVFIVMNPTQLNIFSKGDLFALIGSIFNAGVYLSLKELRHHHDTVTVVFWTYLLSALILFVPSSVYLIELSPLSIIFLLIMCSVGFVGQMLMTLGFKFASAGISSLFMISIIPLTTISGILFFDEVYTITTLIGMGLVFAGLTVVAKWR